jgi:hypothetical protein
LEEEAEEFSMCYEFSEWTRKLRAADQARRERQQREQVTQKPERKPEAPPVAPEPSVKERERVPA